MGDPEPNGCGVSESRSSRVTHLATLAHLDGGNKLRLVWKLSCCGKFCITWVSWCASESIRWFRSLWVWICCWNWWHTFSVSCWAFSLSINRVSRSRIIHCCWFMKFCNCTFILAKASFVVWRSWSSFFWASASTCFLCHHARCRIWDVLSLSAFRGRYSCFSRSNTKVHGKKFWEVGLKIHGVWHKTNVWTLIFPLLLAAPSKNELCQTPSHFPKFLPCNWEYIA